MELLSVMYGITPASLGSGTTNRTPRPINDGRTTHTPRNAAEP